MTTEPRGLRPPFKVLMLAPTPFFSDRGCHVRIYEEAEVLRRCGHEVGIVTYHLGRDVGCGPVWRTPRIPWYTKTSAGPSWHKPYIDFLLLAKAWKVVRKWKPDLIHAHLHEGAFVGIFLRWLTGLPIVFDCQGSLVGEILDHGFMREGSLLHRFFARVEAWVNQQSDAIVTSSTQMAEWIKGKWPELQGKVVPLPDAVDTELFKPLGKDTELLQQLGIPSDKKLLVYLGAMTEYQGVGLLLDVLASLFVNREDVHALIMGYPEHEYVARAKALGVADRVTFTGRIEYSEAPRYLSLGDIALSPKLSKTEANGKLLNYMACGLPCVVFDTPVNRELLGDVGVYAPVADSSAYLRAIMTLLDSPEEMARLAQRTRDHSVNHHCWAARISSLEQIYRRLMKDGSF